MIPESVNHIAHWIQYYYSSNIAIWS